MKFFAIWRSIFGSFVKTAFYISRGSFWETTYFEKDMKINETFRTLSEIGSARLSKLLFVPPKDHFGKENFSKKNLILMKLRLFNENFSVFQQKNIDTVVGTAFDVSTGIFCGEKLGKV